MALDWFDRATEIVGVTLLNGMLIVGLLQVINRYVDLPVNQRRSHYRAERTVRCGVRFQ